MRGFTLAEIMIAVAILGLIGMLSYGTFANSLDASERALAVEARYHEIRQGMERMAREISMSFLSAHRFCEDPRTRTIFKVENEGGGQALTFTSFSHVKMKLDANESDQNVVTFLVETDPTDTKVHSVMRREKAPIDEEPEKGGESYPLIHDVDSLNFEFYDDKNDTWEDDWSSEGQDHKYLLPLFVKITLKAKNHRGKVETFVTKTELPLHKVGWRDDQIYFAGAKRCIDN
jgi:general secretion pathway protein J